MNLSHCCVFIPRPFLRFGSALGLAVATVSAAFGATLTGNVNNVATGNLLGGARVEIPALKAVALADQTGRYVFNDVPAGSYEVVATYLGLDESRATVN